MKSKTQLEGSSPTTVGTRGETIQGSLPAGHIKPAGVHGSVQLNLDGALAADDGLTFDPNTQTLTLGGVAAMRGATVPAPGGSAHRQITTVQRGDYSTVVQANAQSTLAGGAASYSVTLRRDDVLVAQQRLLEFSLAFGLRLDGAQAMRFVGVPATVSSTGAVGDVAADATHLYVCIAPNTWRRAALSTW